MTEVLISCLHLQRNFEAFRSEYEALGVEPVLPEIFGQQLNASQMRDHILGKRGVIAGDDEIDAVALEAGKSSGLKAVVKWGIGTDSIDKKAAAELGIPVFNTPGVFSDEVADLAMSHLLMLLRGTHQMHSSILEGGWHKIEGRSLRGMTAGVVGLGSIGLGIADRAHAFGMKVIGSDVASLPVELLESHFVKQVSFEEVLKSADVVILACNLTDENRHLINDTTLSQMKQGSYLLNFARGPLVRESALVRALANGHLAGAGLDVFEVEPMTTDNPLRKFDNCIFTTHNGSNTKEAVQRINRMTTDILFDALGIKSVQGFTPNRVA